MCVHVRVFICVCVCAGMCVCMCMCMVQLEHAAFTGRHRNQFLFSLSAVPVSTQTPPTGRVCPSGSVSSHWECVFLHWECVCIPTWSVCVSLEVYVSHSECVCLTGSACLTDYVSMQSLIRLSLSFVFFLVQSDFSPCSSLHAAKTNLITDVNAPILGGNMSLFSALTSRLTSFLTQQQNNWSLKQQQCNVRVSARGFLLACE